MSNFSHDKARRLYGVNPVLEAIRSGRKVISIHISRQRHENVRGVIEEAEARGIPVTFEEKDFFDARFPKGHQGVAAMVGPEPVYTLNDLFLISERKAEPPFYLIIDGVVDPHNLGAIIRTAEVGGVHGIIMQKRRVAGGDVVAKASAGATEFIPIVRLPNIKHAMMEFSQRGISVLGAEADAEALYWEADLTVPLAIVAGSEGKGLHETVKRYCDSLIRLPVKGRINSLNVSVATGIIIYEVLRQRAAIP